MWPRVASNSSDSSSMNDPTGTFEGTATAAVAFNRFTAVKSASAESSSRHKRRKGSRASQTYSLHELSMEDTKSFFKHAAKGNLTDLRSSLEKFEITLKVRDENGATLLHCAAVNNQTAVMKYLMESGVDMNAVDEEGNTALHLAVQNEQIDALHLLLGSGARDTVLNKKGNAPLHIAAAMKNTNVLAAILEYDVDMSIAGWRNRTPLHVIAENDNLEACKVLQAKVESKTNKQLRYCATDEDGLTPSHLAARMNSHRTLDFFIIHCRSHGYPTETVLGFLDEENSTPLHAAVDRGNNEVVKVLLKHGASPTACREGATPPLHLACSQGRVEIVQSMVESAGKVILRKPDSSGKTPLHYCAYSIHSHCIVSYIVQQVVQGQEIDQKDNAGLTPLHKAIRVGNLAVVKELLCHGANARVQDSNGENALHIAVRVNRNAIITELLQLQCAANLCTEKNHNGFTAVHFALRMGYGDLISSMLFTIKFQQTDVKDKFGNSYLHLAALSGNWKAVSTLLDTPKKNLNETNNSGATPLHFAAVKGNYLCVQQLLNSGAMVHKCNCGLTPLMVACREGHTDCAQLLYESHPFQINWKDTKGNTALHYAARSKNPCMVRLVLNFGCSVTHNHNDESFFDMIIASRDISCALVVIEHKRWQECLDFTSPSHPHPMVGLIQEMPDVAKAVLDRSHVKPSSMSEGSFKEKFVFKYVRCECDHSSTRKQTVQSDSVSDMPEDNDTSAVPLFSVRYKGSETRRTVTSREPSTKSVPSMEILQTMMKYKRIDLLIHPVVNAYLKMKWKNYGRPLYLISFFCLALLVMLLSVFVSIVPNPTQQVIMTSSLDSQSPMGNMSVVENVTNTDTDLSAAAQTLRVLILIINTMFAGNVAAFIYTSGMKCLNFVRYIHRWIYAFGVLFNYVFLLAPNPLDVWPVGAVACFLSWLMLVMALEYFGVFGTYVKMFTTILRTVFQVLIICVFLLIGFAFSFYILAGGITEFSSVGYSLFSMIGYMLGEIPYSQFIRNDAAGLQYGDFLVILVVVVTILMTIVMANLLIGLAVGDIERVKLNAVLEHRHTEIEYYTTLDKALPKWLLCRLSQSCSVKYPSTRVSPIRQIWRDFWHSMKDDLLESTDLLTASKASNNNDNMGSIRSELEDVKRYVLELSETIHKLQNIEPQDRPATSSTRRQGLLASPASFDYRSLLDYEQSISDGSI